VCVCVCVCVCVYVCVCLLSLVSKCSEHVLSAVSNTRHLTFPFRGDYSCMHARVRVCVCVCVSVSVCVVLCPHGLGHGRHR